jgi:glycosyltransferase involved in cell wall biosynthesis
MKQRILVLTAVKLSANPRVERQLKSLSAEYEVITAGLGNSPFSFPHIDLTCKRSVRLFRVNLLALPRVLVLAAAQILRIFWLSDRLFGMTWDALPAWRAVRRLESVQPNYVFAHDVQTLWIVNRISQRSRVWVDLPEIAAWQNTSSWKWRVLWRAQFEHQTKLAAQAGHYFTTVSGGLKREFWERFGINAEEFWNTGIKHQPIAESTPVQDAMKLRLVHTGAAIVSRRLDTMIHAVDGITNVSLDFYLTNLSSAEWKRLHKLAAMTRNVRVHEAVPKEAMLDVISKYDAMLVFVIPDNLNQQYCLPNKFFDALRVGIPIVSGPTPDIADLISQYQIGFVTQTFLASDLRALIESISPSSLLDLRENVRLAADVLCRDDSEFVNQALRKLKANHPA